MFFSFDRINYVQIFEQEKSFKYSIISNNAMQRVQTIGI